MQEEHKRAIQKNFSTLVQRTDLNKMVVALYEKGVLSEAMVENFINESKTPMQHKQVLYRTIMRRGPDAFDKLVETLMEMGQWDLVRDLDPNSPLHTRPRRPELRNSSRPAEADENDYVSIKNKKKEAQKSLGMSSGPAPEGEASGTPAAPPPPAPAPAPAPAPLPANNGDDAVDLSADITNFHVKKSTRFVEEDETKGLRLYRTRGRNRGTLLLLTYVDFAYGTDDFRHGAEMDTKNLKYLFCEMGFRVLTYKNLTYEETKHTLQSLESVLAGSEVVFTVVSSHGYALDRNADTAIRCSDGHLTTDGQIIEFFNHRNMPSLLGVPKVFVFQACRGKEDDYVHVDVGARGAGAGAAAGAGPARGGVATDTGAYSPAVLTPASPTLAERPLYSDTLVVHSTVPGFVSHRDRHLGSWYIQALCEVFAALAHARHVDELFKLVDERLQQRFRIQVSSVDSRGFNKKLFLHPGLYE